MYFLEDSGTFVNFSNKLCVGSCTPTISHCRCNGSCLNNASSIMRRSKMLNPDFVKSNQLMGLFSFTPIPPVLLNPRS
jgi:hypothetical protein